MAAPTFLVFAICCLLCCCSAAKPSEIMVTFRDAEPPDSNEIEDNPIADLGALTRNLFSLTNKLRSNIRTFTGFTKHHSAKSVHTHRQANREQEYANKQGLNEQLKGLLAKDGQKMKIAWKMRTKDVGVSDSTEAEVDILYDKSQLEALPNTYAKLKSGDKGLALEIPTVSPNTFGSSMKFLVTKEELSSPQEPFSSIGIVTHSEGFCTGTFIGPRHILTTADCIYENSKWNENIQFTLGKVCDARGIAVYEWEKTIVPRMWIEYNDREYNYGMIIVKSVALPHTVMDFGWEKQVFIAVHSVSLVGYPPEDPNQCMWHTHCHIKTSGNDHSALLNHDCESVLGTKGAPLYSPYGGLHPPILCIDSHIKISGGKIEHFCVRIDKTSFLNLVHWIEAYNF